VEIRNTYVRQPEVELTFTIAPMKNTFNVKYLDNSERYFCVTVVNKLFWFYGMVLWVSQSKEDISDCKRV